MIKTLGKAVILSLFASALAAVPAMAAMPTLSAYTQGANVQITVTNANPNSQIDLYFQPQSSTLWNSVSNIGRTDFNGYFTQPVSLGNIGVSQLYVIVGGLQSSTVSLFNNGNNNGNNGGCTYNCGSPYGLSLSQNSLTLNYGQSSTVTIYNNGSYNSYNNFYISSNSNSSVASATISGNSVNVYGNQLGSSSISICQSGNSGCASLFVTVNGASTCGYYGCGGNNGNLILSQSTVNVNISQTGYVGISYSGSNYNNFYISSNSNASVASAYISGNQLVVYGLASGSTSINVCASNNAASCASVFVSVAGSTTGTSALWFNPSTPSLYMGQSLAVSINSGVYNNNAYNNYGNAYYISYNSNTGVVSATVSGTVLNLYANQAGTSNITVCLSSLSFCGTVTVIVNGGNGGYGYYGNTVSLSQSNLNLNVGQNSTVTITSNNISNYYSNNYTISSNSSPTVADASVSGNILSVFAKNPGTTILSICQNYNSSGCANLSVTVPPYYYGGSGYGYNPNNNTNVLGASTYQNGQLISENGTVYIVYKNTKTGFVSSWVFTGLGFSFSNVINVGYSNLISSGYTVQTSQAAHPWGSWIKSGSAVYFVHEAGLIPVPDWNTFLSNGGQSNLIVTANIYDFRLPMLSSMVMGDSRLR